MKLKCIDGKTRRFEVAHGDGDFMPDGTRHNGYSPAYCLECSKDFGCHDTTILKPRFKKHICETERIRVIKRRK